MAKAPDDDSWLERIRCPRYFDFEEALTVPCPSGGETNPPLRDSVYESDDETRTFFHTLETDSSLHRTPHPQENSPPRQELRNVRPIYRHRPSTSFQEYLQTFTESGTSPPCDTGRENLPPSQDAVPCAPSKAPVTPRRNGQGKSSRISSRKATTSGGVVTNLVSEYKSPPTSQLAKADPSTPLRHQAHISEETTRKSVPNESALLRRRRPPERVTPPISSGASKSTSGGFGRNKSRKAIARSEEAEGLQGQISQTGKCAPHTTFSPKKVERSSPVEKENVNQENKAANLLHIDPEILRMMEEHNRRIQKKKALSEGNDDDQGLTQSKNCTINNRAHDQNGARHGRGITVRNRRTAIDLEALPPCDKLRESRIQEPAKTSLKKGRPEQSQDQRRSEQHGSQQDLESNRQNRTNTNSLHVPPLLPSGANSTALKNKSENSKDDDACLDELLRSENERVLQDRKKRLPERRRALQVDKTVALNSLEGQGAEQDPQRTQAKVEFTSVKQISRSRVAAHLEKDKKGEARQRNPGKGDKERDISLGSKPRKRGLKGLRERSKTGPSPSVSSGLSKGPSNAQITRPTASTRFRQPYTDRIKAMERKKRLERRLEEDLQELLSQHNSRVQGNRKTCSANDR